MPHGKVATSEAEFYREFRSKIRDPLIKKLGTSKELEESGILKALESEIPVQVYTAITREETQQPKSGVQKYLGALGYLARWMEGAGYGKFVPYLTPILQPCVELIYRGVIQRFADRFGIGKFILTLLGFDVANIETTPTQIPVASSSPGSGASGQHTEKDSEK